MKKLNLNQVQEGVRKLGAVKQLFEHMDIGQREAVLKVLAGLMGGGNGLFIITYPVNSGTTTNVNLSEGAAVYNSQYHRIPAFTGVVPSGQVARLKLVTLNTKLNYTDGTQQDTLTEDILQWEVGIAGGALHDFGASYTSFVTQLQSTLSIDSKITVAINSLVNAAPGTLDTLSELANALGGDANFATTMANALAGKLGASGVAIGDMNLKLKPGVYSIESYNGLDWATTNAPNNNCHGDLLVYGDRHLMVQVFSTLRSFSHDLFYRSYYTHNGSFIDVPWIRIAKEICDDVVQVSLNTDTIGVNKTMYNYPTIVGKSYAVDVEMFTKYVSGTDALGSAIGDGGYGKICGFYKNVGGVLTRYVSSEMSANSPGAFTPNLFSNNGTNICIGGSAGSDGCIWAVTLKIRIKVMS